MMYRFLPLLLLGALIAPLLPAQTQQKEVRIRRMTVPGEPANLTWQAGSGEGPALALHGADIRFEGPQIEGAPYSAEAVTETTQTLADGNRIRRENTAKIFRDSQGRTRRESSMDSVGPWATGDRREMIFINDPGSTKEPAGIFPEATLVVASLPWRRARRPTASGRARTVSPRRQPRPRSSSARCRIPSRGRPGGCPDQLGLAGKPTSLTSRCPRPRAAHSGSGAVSPGSVPGRAA